jgi:hypothetical protein
MQRLVVQPVLEQVRVGDVDHRGQVLGRLLCAGQYRGAQVDPCGLAICAAQRAASPQPRRPTSQ